MTPDAAENVARQNAERMYFSNWSVPAAEGRYARSEPFYDCEALNPAAGEFVKGASVLDDVGKY